MNTRALGPVVAALALGSAAAPGHAATTIAGSLGGGLPAKGAGVALVPQG
jgi:hypothetical protein